MQPNDDEVQHSRVQSPGPQNVTWDANNMKAAFAAAYYYWAGGDEAAAEGCKVAVAAAAPAMVRGEVRAPAGITVCRETRGRDAWLAENVRLR